MATFDGAIGYILQNEGGFQANPNDSGNYDSDGSLQGTNFGITVRTARTYGYDGDMRDMPQEVAIAIYEFAYWRGLEGINSQAVATKILDMRVNFGVGAADRMAQRAANMWEGIDIAEDGIIGPRSIAAINSLPESEYLGSLVEVISDRYRQIAANDPQKEGFLAGWLKRAAEIPSMIADNPKTSIGIALAAALGLAIVARKKKR